MSRVGEGGPPQPACGWAFSSPYALRLWRRVWASFLPSSSKHRVSTDGERFLVRVGSGTSEEQRAMKGRRSDVEALPPWPLPPLTEARQQQFGHRLGLRTSCCPLVTRHMLAWRECVLEPGRLCRNHLSRTMGRSCADAVAVALIVLGASCPKAQAPERVVPSASPRVGRRD